MAITFCDGHGEVVVKNLWRGMQDESSINVGGLLVKMRRRISVLSVCESGRTGSLRTVT